MFDTQLLWVIISAGFIDSFNPCAISLLLIYISLIFTLRKDRREVLYFGLAYIISIYITYLMIGLGLLRAGVAFTAYPVSKIGAAFVIFFAIMNIKEYFFPNSPFSIRIPLKIRGYVSKFAYQATVLSAIVVGFLIGIYEFPCSGAIYLAIVSLLADKTNFATGVSYLLVYNVMFILPLIVIFGLASNKLTTEKFINLQEKHGRKMHLVLALFMLILGFTIFFITF